MSRNQYNIYIVGYPKSGTSWLTRLIAHILKFPVRALKDKSEVTVEINKRLKLKQKSSNIFKTHSYPKELFGQAKEKPTHIIYIYRDFKAVFISSLFYFSIPKKYSFLFALKETLPRNKKRKLLRWFLFPFVRIFLNFKLKDAMKRGISKGKFGKWDKHIFEWKNASLVKNKECEFVFVAYEDLMKNPKIYLERILHNLGFTKTEEMIIEEAINMESFDQMKLRLTPNSNPVEIALLRAGKADDWKNYLSESNLKRISECVSSSTIDW